MPAEHHKTIVVGGGFLGLPAGRAHAIKDDSGVLIIERAAEPLHRVGEPSQGLRRGSRWGPGQASATLDLIIGTYAEGKQLDRDYDEFIRKGGKVPEYMKNILSHECFIQGSRYLMCFPNKEAMEEAYDQLEEKGLLPDGRDRPAGRPHGAPKPYYQAYSAEEASQKFKKNFPKGSWIIDVGHPKFIMDQKDADLKDMARHERQGRLDNRKTFAGDKPGSSQMNMDRIMALARWDFERHGGKMDFNTDFEDYYYKDGLHHFTLNVAGKKKEVTCDNLTLAASHNTGNVLAKMVAYHNKHAAKDVSMKPMEIPERYRPEKIIYVPQVTLLIKFKKPGTAGIQTTYWWNGGEKADDLGAYSFMEQYRNDDGSMGIALKIGIDCLRDTTLMDLNNMDDRMRKQIGTMLEYVEKYYGVTPDDYTYDRYICGYPIDEVMSPSLGNVTMGDATVQIIGPAIGLGGMIGLELGRYAANGFEYPEGHLMNPNTTEKNPAFDLYGPGNDFEVGETEWLKGNSLAETKRTSRSSLAGEDGTGRRISVRGGVNDTSRL